MRMTLGKEDLAGYVARQMSAVFPDHAVEREELGAHVDRALERLEHCFSRIRLKRFFDGSQSVFNHLNTDQYAMFLYFLSNTIFRMEGDPSLAEKAYALNKALHGLDVYYEVELPEIFGVQHPVGTVLGRARFSNYLFVYQRCSVGANLKNVYPTIGEGVVMFGGSAILGDCVVADNVWLSVGATVMDQSIPKNKVVFGGPRALVVKDTRRDAVKEMFSRA